MDHCTSQWVRVDKDHHKLTDKWNVAAISRNEIIEVTGCPNEDETVTENKADQEKQDKNKAAKNKGKSTTKGIGKKKPHHGLCDKIQMARIPKKNEQAYNMIKIEFNQLSDPELLNAAAIADYVGVEFKSKNDQLRNY